MTARKHLLEEFDDLTSIASPTKSAKVHGLVTKLSPMKTGGGKPYFEGRLADDTTSLRVVGFSEEMQQQMASHQQQQNPVALDNCLIQKSKFGDNMEVLINKDTSISPSPKQFRSIDDAKSNNITLDQLPQQTKFETVTVSAKVLKLARKVEVKDGLWKQDVTLADSSGTGRLTLWQENIDMLSEGKSYKLTDLLVNSFANTNYLTYPKSGCSYSLIEDLQEVMAEPQQHLHQYFNAEVVSVSNFTRGTFCVIDNCYGTIIPTNNKIGTCTSCSGVQLLQKSKKSITALLLISSQGESRKFYVNFTTMKAIAAGKLDIDATNEDIIEALLMASPFSFSFEGQKIVSVNDN